MCSISISKPMQINSLFVESYFIEHEYGNLRIQLRHSMSCLTRNISVKILVCGTYLFSIHFNWTNYIKVSEHLILKDEMLLQINGVGDLCVTAVLYLFILFIYFIYLFIYSVSYNRKIGSRVNCPWIKKKTIIDSNFSFVLK
jgi:hypothetical protein